MTYRRERQARWDRRHLVTVSTHLTEGEYWELRALCAAEGRKPYELLRTYLLAYMAARRAAVGRESLELLAYRTGVHDGEQARSLENSPI